MKAKVFPAMALAGLMAMFASGGAAQQSQNQPQEPANQQPSDPPMMGGPMTGHPMHGPMHGPMNHNTAGNPMCSPEMHAQMMAMMGRMTGHHQDVANLTGKLAESLDAIEKETDPAAVKAKLAEHRNLLRQLRVTANRHRVAMQEMAGHMKNCPMMGNMGMGNTGTGNTENPPAK